MLWLFLEILLGLALFAGIVWWTLPREKRDRPDDSSRSGDR